MMPPARTEDSPRFFVSHGMQDTVLPIDRTSRRIVPRLEADCYEVDYREFPDGHTVPPEIARDAVEVSECHRITGEDCYLLRLHLRSIEDLEEVLDRFTPYGLTTTSIVHSTPLARRGPPLVSP